MGRGPLIAWSWCLFVVASALGQTPPETTVSGEARIARLAGPAQIVIHTTSRLAGAIDSLTWNGQAFIDSFDHGRQLQSASNFDAGSPLTNETFNPTEAGSRHDGTGPMSTSQLLRLVVDADRLQTESRMAFWLRPGERSGPHLAKNTTLLSNHGLRKDVRIGLPDLPHVIDYRVVFTVPAGERHTQAVFEALTGYMPPEFSRFLAFDPQARRAVPLDDGPGEQRWPVIFTLPSGSHAMGIVSPERLGPGWSPPGYGRFRFERERVVKWNCVFRLHAPTGVPSGEYPFRMFVIVGTLDDVTRSMARLLSERG